MKLTPPALVMGVGFTAYEGTTAVMEAGATNAAIAFARNLADLPSELRSRLNSDDPSVRGEALADTLAIAAASTAIVGRLQQTGSNAITTALEKQAALRAEANAITKLKVENNIRKYDSDIYFEYKDQDGRWLWPPSSGAADGTRRMTTLENGYSIDRYGDDLGHFVAPLVEAISNRSLARSGLCCGTISPL